MAEGILTVQSDRAGTALKRERLRIMRISAWHEFIKTFMPKEGQRRVVKAGADIEPIDVEPALRDALHRALIMACEALEAEAIRDVRRSRIPTKTKEGDDVVPTA